MPKQGDVYWILASEMESNISHPHVIIQDHSHNHANTVVVCALTTNRKRAKLPGNVLLEVGEANLPKQSIVVVSQKIIVEKSQLGEYIGSLSEERMRQILSGVKFVEEIMGYR